MAAHYFKEVHMYPTVDPDDPTQQRPMSDLPEETGDIDIAEFSRTISKAGRILAVVVTVVILLVVACCAGLLFLNYALGTN